MNGDVVKFNDPHRALEDATNELPEHDPLRRVLTSQQTLWTSIENASRRFDASQILTPEAERKLCDRVVNSSRGAICDVFKQLNRTIVFALACGIATTVLVSAIGGCWVGWTLANNQTVEVWDALGEMPVGTAALWAKLVRNNPRIIDAYAHATPIDQPAGGKAVSLLVWTEPPATKQEKH